MGPLSRTMRRGGRGARRRRLNRRPPVGYNGSPPSRIAMTLKDPTVDFGFERVPWGEKAARVREVFTSVAGKYDVMNDLMSFGVHRLWKQFTLSLTGLRPGQQALDVAGGTGDLAAGMARQVGKAGRVVLSDINPAMLD